MVAALLTDARADGLTLPWAQLHCQHTQAVRSRLADRYQSATVNKILAAVRGVLRESLRLGLIDGDHYHRAVGLPGVSGHTLPRGRALSAGEIRGLFAACAATTHRPARVIRRCSRSSTATACAARKW